MAKEVSSLKKAYCPHCKVENELEHIFAVSPDVEVCYCPNCMREYKPKDVIDNYNYFIANKITRAERLLYRDTKFYEAYCAFADIIEIDSSICKARFGRILSLIYMSKLRKSNFANAMTLLESEAEQYFHKMRDFISYFKFLSRANGALDEYQKRFYEKVSIRDRFYNEDCVALYYQRLKEIIELKKLLLEETQKLSLKSPDERFDNLMRAISNSLVILNTNFKEPVTTTDGTRYKVAKVASQSQILVVSLDDRLNPIGHFVRYKLDENEKRGKLLKDKVYPDNIHISRLTKVALPLMIFFLLLAFGAVGASFLFFDDKKYDYALYFLAGSFFITAIIWMVLLISGKAKLSKRHHLID